MLTYTILPIIVAGFLALAATGGADRVCAGSVDRAVSVQRGLARISVPTSSAQLWLNDNFFIAEEPRETRTLHDISGANTPFESICRFPLTGSTPALSTAVIGAKVPLYLFESILNL
jgi:hypothetical protein